MSKSEKFIQDNIKRCSEGIRPFEEWLTPDEARAAIEIAREELLEKVCSFIDDNMAEYIDIRGYTGSAYIDVRSDRFINDIKQAVKDE